MGGNLVVATSLTVTSKAFLRRYKNVKWWFAIFSFSVAFYGSYKMIMFFVPTLLWLLQLRFTNIKTQTASPNVDDELYVTRVVMIGGT